MLSKVEVIHETRVVQTRRRTMRIVYIIVAMIVVLVSQIFWLPWIGAWLIVADPLPAQPADALVPLAGDRSRVSYAAQLFEQDYARWFVLTNMWIDSSSSRLKYASLVRSQAIEDGVAEDRILIAAEQVRTTYDEALSLRRLAQEHEWQSLIVVTSPYHTHRSRMIFREVFRHTNITIAIRPEEQHWYTPENWWQHPHGRRQTGSEYLKLALYLAGYHQIGND